MPLFLTVTLMVILMAGTTACSQTSPVETTPSKPILTVTKSTESKSYTTGTKDIESKRYTMEELKAMPATEWVGCLRHNDGRIEGPFHAKGVTVLDLCNAVGGINTTEAAEANAPDGFVDLPYKSIVESNFKTYDATTGKECPHGDVITLLAYEQDGQPLDKSSGPLRIMILAGDNVATHGYLWMKQITKIDIHEWSGSQAPA